MRWSGVAIRRALRPVWTACSWALGVSAFLLLYLLHWTCRLQVEGSEHAESRGGLIFAFWHEAWFTWLVAFPRADRKRAWLMHPAAYMKPIHVVVRLIGVHMLMTRGGEDARRATARIAELLKGGWLTAIAPDGPRGPAKTLRKGVLHLALESGVPIVPVRCDARPAFRLRSWDRKIVPFPFARIRIRYGVPVTVCTESFSEAQRVLVGALTKS
jgi:lysophospholipid acyltransferase (LPLAT)-like uncharacterized protein